ncbi:MAG: bifunctional alpha,alpha-trehalose-phosphate synthase (UDP-forming)/trehalose-phosphatase [Pseudomonadales bacterium]
MRKIISVANRLPVTIGDTIHKSTGGLVAALDGISRDNWDVLSIGWPGAAIAPDAQADVSAKLLAEYDCLPVYLADDEIVAFYDGFSNSSLWPLLHYNRAYLHYNEQEWQVYQQINERFLEAICSVAEADDLVWVHDYHLMLLPGLLRERIPDLRIGFFLHTPFPSSEIFRCHPRCRELIQGLLGADVLGFHTFGYLRHFRSSTLRLLGLESQMGEIRYGNHAASLGIYPIGINATGFANELASTSFEQTCNKRRQDWPNKRVVLSVERLDYSKGLLRRLEAIESFLAHSPHGRDTLFVFVSIPSRIDVPEYKSLRERIEREVGRINGRYATINHSPIHFIFQSIPFNELCALYATADVALVTPLVDGMNLVAKEYVACQGEDNPGVLILSEFAGAAQELVNALIVNPYDSNAVVDNLNTALEMSLEERQTRMHYMRTRVMRYDANYWAESFLGTLQQQDSEDYSPQDWADSVKAILQRVAASNNCALFLDYDGTLREFESQPEKAFPHEELVTLLQTLNTAPIDVYIISGRKNETLGEWFANYNFTLIAEHGNRFKLAGETQWRSLNPATDFSWKTTVLEIFQHYEGSTPGSFVEDKQSALVWHYRQADPEFGAWKAHQLLGDMYEMLANFPVEIHHGKRIVEVSSIHVNKGAALEHFIKRNNYDCILCAGDDQTDEAMFKVECAELASIKVGEGDSLADYRIPEPVHFRQLLEQMLNNIGTNELTSA